MTQLNKEGLSSRNVMAELIKHLLVGAVCKILCYGILKYRLFASCMFEGICVLWFVRGK